MSCLTTIASLLVWLVLFLAGVAIIRIVIAAVFGMPMWPGWPPYSPAPPAPSVPGPFAAIGAVLIAILDVVFWAILVIGLIWFVVDLFGCALGFAHLPSPPWR